MDSIILFTKNGTPFIVDENDADSVMEETWSEMVQPCGTYIRSGQHRDGNYIPLQHFVLQIPEKGNHVHHKNGCPQDNRKNNLEELSRGDHRAKCKDQKSSTGVRGAYRRGKKFLSQIRFNSKTIHIGFFDTAEEAGAAFLKKRIDLRGF